MTDPSLREKLVRNGRVLYDENLTEARMVHATTHLLSRSAG